MAAKSPKCLALISALTASAAVDDNKPGNPAAENYFKSAQWSPDGTSVITNSADNGVRTFIVPPDLLEDRGEDNPFLELVPYSTAPSAEPVSAVTCYPQFSLQDPSTTLLLSSVRDHPIRLHSALDGSRVASYPLVDPMTERYISPHSLLFTRGGSQFLAGGDSLLAIFDTGRPGDPPSTWLPTGPRKGGTFSDLGMGMGMRGIASSLSLEPASDVLAAGTYSRHVGLYGSGGHGECLGVFCVGGTKADEAIRGGGITQVLWSPCGRYLYIAERKSEGAMFYDIRKTGQLLGWLEGRHAMTNQRLSVDVVSTGEGHDVWAGGVDGNVRRWTNPVACEGVVQPSLEWQVHDDAVNAAAIHPSADVMITSSGQRHFEDGPVDDSLKIWTW